MQRSLRRRRADNSRCAESVDDLTVRHLAFRRIERLVLKEDDRIGIAYGGRQQPYHVSRRRRRHDLEARNHHAPVFDALAVLGAETRSATVGRANDQGHLNLPVRHVPALGEFVGYIVEAHSKEVRKHDLGDRLEARHRCAHGSAHDRLFRNGRIAHTQRAELVEQSNGGLEYPAGLGNVLAEKHNVRVARHLLLDAAGDCIAIGQFRHAQPPSA